MSSFPEPGSSESINTGRPSEPRTAATVILLRDSEADGSLEVLLLKRSPESHFMPSVWVFPGGSLDPEDGEGIESLATCARREMSEEAGVELGPETEMIPLARWVTPEIIKVRFDTYFFLAAAPPGAEVQPDQFEMSEAIWIAPAAAVEKTEQEGFPIVFPTLKQLEALVPSPNTAAAMESARNDPDATTIVLPKVIGDKENPRIILPHEDDYPD
ncbi:MAG: NUDIX hydrolase [Thermoleophilia bacterium]|nr:NUDIX hydrolase [Thermoleophilia bacterium]